MNSIKDLVGKTIEEVTVDPKSGELKLRFEGNESIAIKPVEPRGTVIGLRLALSVTFS